jgi:hypothetical protein
MTQTSLQVAPKPDAGSQAPIDGILSRLDETWRRFVTTNTIAFIPPWVNVSEENGVNESRYLQHELAYHHNE